ncbi:hypothetical protein K239x_41070 [Planctomycetes bacterium K23_9]|uniref:Uncharacterized protein n=1 Tax=Stieleria marina TaxID=1930275 RepID=A0A517NYA6_9BACT|nr:hypothetical protein K239x_41070 [Planctomycetes bacterium K23_9]
MPIAAEYLANLLVYDTRQIYCVRLVFGGLRKRLVELLSVSTPLLLAQSTVFLFLMTFYETASL